MASSGAIAHPEIFAYNELVLIVPKDNPASIREFEDLPRARRLVVGAPCGSDRACTPRELLRRAEHAFGPAFASSARKRVVSEETNVRLVRAKVELGEADAAIVYRTDATDRVQTIEIPASLNVRAGYQIGLVGSEPTGLAKRLDAVHRAPQRGGRFSLDMGSPHHEVGIPVSFSREFLAGALGCSFSPRSWCLLSPWRFRLRRPTLPRGSDIHFSRRRSRSSGRTTLLSLLVVVVAGTPLGWWLAVGPRRLTRVVEIVVVLPIVIPPAVLGVALLQAFGRSGLIGPLLASLDLQVPFTTTAVVLTQVVVSAPFYVASAAIAFRRVDIDLVLVARTLGASPASAFFRVAVPVAATGLLGGAALAYARAIGEFGATLLFAGNLSGTTQTMPLAIYMALESDVRAALAISLLLTVIAVALLFAIRLGPRVFASVVLGRDAMDSEGHDR